MMNVESNRAARFVRNEIKSCFLFRDSDRGGSIRLPIIRGAGSKPGLTEYFPRVTWPPTKRRSI